MKITLYKNCILTDSYSEVFNVFTVDINNKTCLDRYLETLEYYEVTAGDVYVPQSGKISFQLMRNGEEFYEYNYMRVENEKSGFKRFCFIDTISVVNNLAVVSYIEDIWSNYAPSMQMRKSLLTRSRIIDYGNYKIPFYAPGMEYQGNNALKLVELLTKDGQIENVMDVGVVMQVQFYQLSEQGEISKRDIVEMFLEYSTSTSTSFIAYAPISSQISYMLNVLQNSSSGTVNYKKETWNYEIYNVVFVPKNFNIALSATSVDSSRTKVMTLDNKLEIYFEEMVGSTFGFTEIQYTKNVVLQPNFKQFMIGTLENAYDLVQNGTNIEIKIGYFVSPLSFNIFLSFQNQLIDITSDFMVEFPISVQTADITQQQATARELANMNAKMGIASGALQIAGGVTDVALGSAMVGMSGSWGKQLKGAGQIAGGIESIGSGIMNTISSAKQLEVANRAQFVTNKGAKVLNNASMNANYGIVIFEMQPDNEVEVQANIDNAGYVVNEIVDNLFITQTTGVANKWNVMRFDYLNIYGKFPQRVADALREILSNGFKIWYDETAVNE